MPFIKLPPSITSREALKMVQGQGFNTIISITTLKDGSKLIEYYFDYDSKRWK